MYDDVEATLVLTAGVGNLTSIAIRSYLSASANRSGIEIAGGNIVGCCIGIPIATVRASKGAGLASSLKVPATRSTHRSGAGDGRRGRGVASRELRFDVS